MIDSESDRLHLRIPCSNLMDVTTFKNTAGRPILEELGIRERMPEARHDAAEIHPKVANFTVNNERRGPIIVRDEPPSTEMERPPSIIVFGESRPGVWKHVSGAYEFNELFVVRITDVPGYWAETMNTSNGPHRCTESQDHFCLKAVGWTIV
jgi:hypothetical protein